MDKKEGGLPGITQFIKGVGGSWKIVLIIAAAFVLLLFSSLGGGASTDGTDDEVESKIEQMCSSLVGVGECRVMVTYSSDGVRYGSSLPKRVESVAIVCKGADRATVRAEIISMISALYGIGANRIFISRMK